jgi:hypothetical protein
LPIPTRADRQLSEIDTASGGILTKLRVMQRAAGSDIPRMRKRLREMLQDYADLVMATAPSGR